MATKENIEYLALLKCRVELSSEISADPLSVSNALVAKGLIPESVHSSVLQQTKNNEVKASELVHQVTNKIRTYPARFDEFLEVLRSQYWLKDVLKSLTAAYKELKSKGNDTEAVTTTSGLTSIAKKSAFVVTSSNRESSDTEAVTTTSTEGILIFFLVS